MPILEKTTRFAAIALAVLFIGLSLFGIFGAWFVDRKATDVALKAFGFIETGVGVVDAGVGRVDDLIATSRTEVRQAAETITAVGAQAQANSPVLNALNERLETSLAPRIAQMQQVLAPVRDAVGTVGNAVSLMNSLPMMAERAPRLAALDETFNRLEGLSADATQLRGTLRALVAEQKSDITPETVAALKRTHAAHRHPAGRGAGEGSGGAGGYRGAAGPAGQAQVAAAVRFQPAGAAVDADAGLDRLHAGRRHPAGAAHVQPPRATIAIDADDIGGVVTGPKGPEAGVWVIAETTDLPTKFVQDRRHRRSRPLPRARSAEGELQRVGARLRPGGFAEGAGAPGQDAEPDRGRRAERRAPRREYYPAGYWFSLLQVPDEERVPGHRPDGQRHLAEHARARPSGCGS